MSEDQKLRLLAADYAEHVLELYERDYPTDERPRRAIQAGRDFARGEVGVDVIDAAAIGAREASFEAKRHSAKAAAAAALWSASRHLLNAADDAARARMWDSGQSGMAIEIEWQHKHRQEAIP